MQSAIPRERFLDALYSAALGATGWTHALESYAALVDAPMGVLRVHFPVRTTSSNVETLNTPTSFLQRSRAPGLSLEPWIRKGYAKVAEDPMHAFRGYVFHGAAEVPTGELLASGWYREFGREFEMQDCLALTARASEGVIVTLSANTGASHLRLFSDDAVRDAESARADFHRAVELHIRLSRNLSLQGTTAQWATSALPVLLSRAGKVIHANPSADAELDRNDIISRTRGDRLDIHDPNLSDLVRDHERSGTATQVTFHATARSGERWLVQLVRMNQLAGSLLTAAGAEDPAVLMVLTPLDMRAAGRERALQSLSLLTAAERDVAYQMLCGDSVADIASQRRQSTETIRWHIRNMIEKAGARNLADLHRILALLLPL